MSSSSSCPKSEKLAYFKGQELHVSDPTDDTLAHYIIRGSLETAADDKIAYVSGASSETSVN